MVLAQNRPGATPPAMLTVPVKLSPAMWDGVQRKAKALGMTGADYLRLLVEAAYTARVAPQGDAEMEAAVSARFKREANR